MSKKVRQDFNEILQVNERILKSLLAQKVRQNDLYDKYKEEVKKEAEIPSNRFLNWSRTVFPFLDSVDTGRLIDYELNQHYKKYIKDLIDYEANFVMGEQEINDLDAGFEKSIRVILRLENKLSELKNSFKKEIIDSKIHSINLYQQMPDEIRKNKRNCKFCGIKLNKKGFGECDDCKNIPVDDKPILTAFVKKEIEDNSDFLLEENNLNNSEVEEEAKIEDDEENLNDNDYQYQEEKTDEKIVVEKNPHPKIEGETKKDRKLKKDFTELMQTYNKKYEKKPEDEEDFDDY